MDDIQCIDLHNTGFALDCLWIFDIQKYHVVKLCRIQSTKCYRTTYSTSVNRIATGPNCFAHSFFESIGNL
ncbi:unnamed protein product [Rotaria sp. Silwood1]|nr:unnamed protein product [Rotaria sp. Silwood1]